MNIYIKSSVAGLILILITLIFSFVVGYEKGLPAVIIIVPATIGFVSFLLASQYSKAFKELLSDVKDIEEEDQIKAIIARNKKEYVYILISAIVSFLLILYILRHYICNLSEERAILLTLFYVFFITGIEHIVASNFISAIYNVGYRFFPYNYISLNTPKRSRYFGSICLLISCIFGIGIFIVKGI
jgi:hypothetical protein